MTAAGREEGPSILDVMARLLADLPEVRHQELHASRHVWSFLRDTYATVIRPELATNLMAMPVLIDEDLTGGQWQILEDGQVIKEGDMAPAPDGMTIMYTPISGWIGIRTDLTEAL